MKPQVIYAMEGNLIMARLVEITSEKRPARELEAETTSIGRHPDNDIVLQDALVSRKHARIIKNPDNTYRITDLGSQNGVYVNNLMIDEEPLTHGDVIIIGSTHFVFDAPHMAEATPVAADEPAAKKTGTISGEEKLKPMSESRESLDFEVEELLRIKSNLRDLGDLGEAQQRELKQRRSLFIIYKVARSLSSTGTVDDLLKQTLEIIVELLDADRGAVFIEEDSGKSIRPLASFRADGKTDVDLSAAADVVARSIKSDSAVLCTDACYMPENDHTPPPEAPDISSVLCVPFTERDEIKGAIYLDKLKQKNAFTESDVDQIAAVANLIGLRLDLERMLEQAKEAAVIRANLQRFHSPDVVDLIMRQSKEVDKFGRFLKEREVTVLFADISEFTSMVERLDAEEAAVLLSDYFDDMTEVIFKYGGTVDKFIGDAIMAIFGAPISRGNDAELAIFAAIEMLQRMEYFKAAREEEHKFDIRFGINTGIVLTGYMGSRKRIEYSVLGDPVNIAARLQHIAEPRTILIGENTYAKVGGLFETKDRGNTQLKGKTHQTRYYEVLYDLGGDVL